MKTVPHPISAVLWLIILTASASAMHALAQKSSAQSPAQTTAVLPRIEKYKAPPYPKSAFLDRETYDYRLASKAPVPATLTDVFICDIWQRLTLDLKLKVKAEDASEALIKQAMQIYLERRADDIAGYRPWTHWHFIRHLTPPQRDLLAQEVVAYIKQNGVKDVD